MSSRLIPTSPEDPSLDRPRIRAGIPVVWRSKHAVQVRLDPAYAVVVEGPDGRIGALISNLDGTRTRAEVIGEAAAAGVSEAVVGDVLAALASNGSLAHSSGDSSLLAQVDGDERRRLAPDLMASALTPGTGDALEIHRRRRHAHVEIRGTGRLGAALATNLAASGVGAIWVTDMGEGESPLVTPYDLTPGGPSSADLGSDRVTAIAAAAARCRIGGEPSPGRRMRAKPGSSTRGTATHPRVRPDLIVRATDALGDFPVVDPSWADELVSDGVVHLSSAVAGTAATIGPLVVPGASACLHCLDLNRRDRDPGWPHVVAASSQAARKLRRDGPAVSVALSSAAAAITAQQVLEYLDGYPSTALATWNAVLLCRLPGPTLTRGSVGRHPQCGCAWGPPDRMSGSERSQWAGE